MKQLIECTTPEEVKERFHFNALMHEINQITEKGYLLYYRPVALARQIELKNLGINTLLTDMYNLKLIAVQPLTTLLTVVR